MKGTEKGYRDTLLWETVIELAQPGTAVAFVSSNNSDFGEADRTGLADELQEERRERGLGAADIALFESVDAFLAQRFPPADTYALQQLESELEDPSYMSQLEAALEELLEYGLPVQLEVWDKGNDASLMEFEGFSSIQVSEVRKGIATIQGEGWASIEVFFDKHEAYALSESNLATLVDPDWNEHYALASIEREVIVTVQAPYLAGEDGGLGDVFSIEIEAAGSGRSQPVQRETLF